MKEKYKKRLAEYSYFAEAMRKTGLCYFNKNISLFGDALVEDDDGESAEHCIWKYESTGKMPACRDVEGLRYLLAAKGGRDWHITTWGEDLARGLLTKAELLADGVPESLVASANKARHKKFGHVKSERCA